MLVLSRKPDQSIIIDGDIKVKVLKVTGNTVRLGIEAPGHMRIIRAELDQWGEFCFDRNKSANREAADPVPAG